ncbi:hypothetical protein E2C01_020581 [Portunus trituberculatus]|uniref:Uncharacterized protein n=1 Tax=Portunus trituberculatus TaxID=210409 RepID=A0A5B7E093_PORTR|nr:hypothetical protein [Portunus trituberculatus]
MDHRPLRSRTLNQRQMAAPRQATPNRPQTTPPPQHPPRLMMCNVLTPLLSDAVSAQPWPPTTCQAQADDEDHFLYLSPTIVKTFLPAPATHLPVLRDLTLYEYTKEELNVTAEILAKCSSLASSKRSSTGSVMDSPAGWWKLKKEQTQEVISSTIDNFCTNDTSPECDKLYTNLSDIMKLLTSLTANVDGWTLEDLDDLTGKNGELEDAYQAATDVSNFENLINNATFQNVISDMQEEVKRSREKVNTKISDIKKDQTGSVVLVAVIGSLGGIMVVSIAGVMIYSAAKKKKMKKESSTTPYNKLQGENIPIDAFLSDGPRADPYTSQSPPHSRGDPYPSPYSGRSKTRDKLSTVHSLVVAMQPVVATKRGFNGPFVSLTAKDRILPAMLVLDKHVKENVAVVSRGKCLIKLHR